MPELSEMIWMGFTGLLTLITGYMTTEFRSIITELKSLTKSVNDLNLKLGQVIITQDWHKEAIVKNDRRITKLESR